MSIRRNPVSTEAGQLQATGGHRTSAEARRVDYPPPLRLPPPRRFMVVRLPGPSPRMSVSLRLRSNATGRAKDPLVSGAHEPETGTSGRSPAQQEHSRSRDENHEGSDEGGGIVRPPEQDCPLFDLTTRSDTPEPHHERRHHYGHPREVATELMTGKSEAASEGAVARNDDGVVDIPAYSDQDGDVR